MSAKIRNVLLAVAALLLLPSLYLYLMYDIRVGDPVRGKTVRHCKHIVTAYQNYTEIYTNMAVLGTETASDLEASSRAFILALNGEHAEANPFGTSFMEKTYTATNTPGSFPDAWQNQYLVRLDDDGDGYIQMGERKVKGTVIAWSRGLDGKNDWAKKDDIFYKE